MRNQLKISFYKFWHFPVFYFVLLFMVAFGAFIGWKHVGLGMDVSEVFVRSVRDTSVIIVLNLVTAWFVGNDFGTRTIHHEITLGHSRWSVLLVRELPVMLCIVILHFTGVAFSVLTCGYMNGFPGSLFQIQDLFWCLTVALQLIAQQSIIVLISCIFATPASAISASAVFTLVTSNILRNFISSPIFTKSVFYLARENTAESLVPAAIVAAITLVVTVSANYLVFRKQEIK